jgi:hypothetical protein
MNNKLQFRNKKQKNCTVNMLLSSIKVYQKTNKKKNFFINIYDKLFLTLSLQ